MKLYSVSRLDVINNRAQQCCAPTNALYSMQLKAAICVKNRITYDSNSMVLLPNRSPKNPNTFLQLARLTSACKRLLDENSDRS